MNTRLRRRFYIERKQDSESLYHSMQTGGGGVAVGAADY